MTPQRTSLDPFHGNYPRQARDSCQGQPLLRGRVLPAIEQGDPYTAEQPLPLVYEERKLAAQKPGQRLQATALVHEAAIRVIDMDKLRYWEGRGQSHFLISSITRSTSLRRLSKMANRAMIAAPSTIPDAHQTQIWCLPTAACQIIVKTTSNRNVIPR